MSRRISARPTALAALPGSRPASQIGSLLGAVAALALILAPVRAAHAADQMLDLAVADAKASRHAKALLDVPFYMAGEKHPAVAQKLGNWPTDQRTNAFGKAHTDACYRVFISAIKVLQQRAQREGGNAVIDIQSTTKDQNLESATQFRCAAGALMANVRLTGTVVKLAGK